MPSPLAPKKIDKIGIHGVIRQAEVDDALIPEGAVIEVQNFHFDKKGAATMRPGIAALGGTVLNARPCVGLHNAQSGTAVAVFSNGGSSAVYTYSGSAWGLSLTEGTASVKVRFVDFGSYSLMIGFNQNTYGSIRFWAGGADGASYWKWTGGPMNMQNMWPYSPQLGEAYKSRVYLAGDTQVAGSGQNASNPSRLFFSSVISSTGNITWNPNLDYVDINPGDGEGITALKRYSLELLVFKPNYTYRFRTAGVDPDPMIKIGTRSHESVVEGKRGIYFFHDTGFYRYSGGYPVEISRPIIDFVAAIPFSQFKEISGWNDADHIYWSVGNLSIAETKETITWKNVVLRYTESSQIWTIYSYSSDIRRGIAFNNGSTITRIVGLDNGVVATHNSGTTDIGEQIKYRVRTKWYDWDIMSHLKTLNTLSAICEKAQGSLLFYRTDEEISWHTIGQLKQMVNIFRNKGIRFHRIQFEITGTSTNEAPIFRELEILEGLNEGIIW